MKELNLGQFYFRNIIENNNYFVDKSLLIKEVIKAQKNVLLFPRSRHFGKTLNLSMIKYFVEENSLLFNDLKIWKINDEIKQYHGKYSVIYLTLKDAKKNSWKKCYQQITDKISKLYKYHSYILSNGLLNEKETIDFKNIINKTGRETKFEKNLINLSAYLQRLHNEKVVILVDEYDAPILAGYKKYYEQVISFILTLLSDAFKYNSNLYKGIITGILRVSRESIFSGLNNLSVLSSFGQSVF